MKKILLQKRLTQLLYVRKFRVIAIFGVLLAGCIVATIITPFEQPKITLRYAETASEASVVYMRAEVLAINDTAMRVRLLDGPLAGDEEMVSWGGEEVKTQTIDKGSTVIVGQFGADQDSMSLIEIFRLPILIMMTALFTILVLAVGGRRGATSLAGLGVGVMVLGWFVVPFILAGYDAFWVCVAGAYVIALTSILIAHGPRKRTFISLLCIAVILALVCVLSYVAAWVAHLSGITEETTYYLQQALPELDLRGVLAGGIIIATLGVLDDIVTAQVAVVEELKKANPSMRLKEVYSAGASVGKEHIASLVNTLALAYAGASLPYILYLAHGSVDSIVTLLNNEYLASEIVRTLVASSGLVLAVPVSTLTAAYIYHRLVR